MFLKSLRSKRLFLNRNEDPYPVGSSPAILYGQAKNPKPVKDSVLLSGLFCQL